MIELRRKDLNKTKLDELLKAKMDLLVGEYVADCVRRGSHMSTLIVEDFKGYLMNSEYLSFTNYGRFSAYHTTSLSLTIDDLIDGEVLDEEYGVYHVSYDSYKDFHGCECRLLGVYSSIDEVRSQIDRIRDGKEKSYVVEFDDLNIKFVPVDWMVDVYLDGYVEQKAAYD